MRLRSLDSLRGIAAAAVVLHHATLSIPGAAEDRAALWAQGYAAPWAWLYLTPLRLLVGGPVAVYIFFVLSGLVLALTFVERDGDRYLPYAVKRVTRIWIPYAGAVAFSWMAMHLIGHDRLPGASDWFNFTWSQVPGRRQAFDYIFMTGCTISLDNPMWSLVHEIRISLVFPLLVLLCRWNWAATLMASVLLAIAASRYMAHHPLWLTYASILQTCTYLFLFVVGIGIAFRSRGLRQMMEQLSWRWRAVLWVAVALGLAVAPVGTMSLTHWNELAATGVNAAAAALLILLCIAEGRALTILTARVPLWLGRVSYSLYLTHVIVLVGVARLLPSTLSLGWRLAAGVAASLVFADLFWRLVEEPAGRWGRRLAARWVPTGSRQRSDALGHHR